MLPVAVPECSAKFGAYSVSAVRTNQPMSAVPVAEDGKTCPAPGTLLLKIWNELSSPTWTSSGVPAIVVTTGAAVRPAALVAVLAARSAAPNRAVAQSRALPSQECSLWSCMMGFP